MTAASLFRTLHARGGTLLLDEAERFKNSKSPEIDEQVSMLLAGYKRGGSAIRLEPQGDGRFKPTTFSVFGPKAMACISGLPPTLASRAIQITMFRAAPGSRKPVRRIDASPMRWQTLRDALHAVALEYGPRWLELAGYTDVCPPMGGREFELWQPILAIASFMEEAGARGLLKQMQDHALATVEATKDDQTPEADETLLGLMATAAKIGSSPTPGELLDEARKSDPETFRRWSPKGISERYKRYGLRTNKTAGRKVYSTVTLHDLMQIQRNYGIDLGVSQAG
jgi:hypothetical protein